MSHHDPTLVYLRHRPAGRVASTERHRAAERRRFCRWTWRFPLDIDSARSPLPPEEEECLLYKTRGPKGLLLPPGSRFQCECILMPVWQSGLS